MQESSVVKEATYTPVTVFLAGGSVLEFEEAWDVTWDTDFLLFQHKNSHGRNCNASFDLRMVAGVSVAK